MRWRPKLRADREDGRQTVSAGAAATRVGGIIRSGCPCAGPEGVEGAQVEAVVQLAGPAAGVEQLQSPSIRARSCLRTRSIPGAFHLMSRW